MERAGKIWDKNCVFFVRLPRNETLSLGSGERSRLVEPRHERIVDFCGGCEHDVMRPAARIGLGRARDPRGKHSAAQPKGQDKVRGGEIGLFAQANMCRLKNEIWDFLA